MKRVNKMELKKIQLEILDVVDKFCEENKINYWLDCGTLLGAIRHKGYIPWDDDIDIGMLRKDYDKFMNLFNKKNDRYKFYSYENNKKFYYSFGKVLDTNTVLYEPDEKTGNKLSINIDTFVYDNAPSSIKELNRLYKKRDIYNKLVQFKYFNFNRDKSSIVKKLVKLFISLVFKLIPNDYFAKKMVKNSKKYSNFNTDFIGSFNTIYKVHISKKVFSSFLKKEFEGKKYNVPVGYDEYLRSMYGDYMKLPPKEKQVSHHSFVAYMK